MTKDLFSRQAGEYARFRPYYPAAFMEYIMSFVPELQIAWDCATGNGQAATLLARRASRVLATDISARQIAQAAQNPVILYRQCEAEKTPFPNNCFDLITVAQAYHWLNFDLFGREASRVAKAGAWVAIWGYGLIQTEDKVLQEKINGFYQGPVGAYWDPERKYIDEAYTTVPFPFQEIPTPPFVIPVYWRQDELLGYLRTWSSVQHYIRQEAKDPVLELEPLITRHWGNDAAQTFWFPLFLRMGRVVK